MLQRQQPALMLLGLFAFFIGCLPNPSDEVPDYPIRLVKQWESDSVLFTSESVLFDDAEGIFFVSCIGNTPPNAKDGDGFIAKLAYYGNIIEEKWVTGLDAPKGMAIIGDTLYVADITNVKMISKTSGMVIDTIEIDGAQFLNDITLDEAHNLYVSDTDGNKIYKLTQGEVEVWLDNEDMGGPNGLYAEANRLMVATFGAGRFSTVDLHSKEMVPRTEAIEGSDGIVKLDNGYLISNWNGEVYHVNEKWEKTMLLDTKGLELNAADIEIVPEHNMLLVPTFFGNSVVAYEIRKNEMPATQEDAM